MLNESLSNSGKAKHTPIDLISHLWPQNIHHLPRKNEVSPHESRKSGGKGRGFQVDRVDI